MVLSVRIRGLSCWGVLSMLLNETKSVVLDSSGNGSIRLAFPGKFVRLNRLTVATSPATREVLCRVYRDFIGAPYLMDTTYTGGTGDTSDTVYQLPDGTALFVVWEAGDSGATATVTYSGEYD